MSFPDHSPVSLIEWRIAELAHTRSAKSVEEADIPEFILDDPIYRLYKNFTQIQVNSDEGYQNMLADSKKYPGNPFVLAACAHQAKNFGEYRKSAELIEKAVRLRGDQAVWLSLAGEMAQKLGRLGKGSSFYQKASDLNDFDEADF